MQSADQLRERLSQVLDPELGASIVELGMVGNITVTDGRAVVQVSLTTVGCPLRAQIERDVKEAALSLDDIDKVDLIMGVLDAPAKAALMKRARSIAQESAPSTSIPTQTPVLMIASGKGGVGKSSITANLAVALAATGRCIGVLDADIWGFSLSRLLGIQGDVEAIGGKMQPLERRVGDGSIKLLSMGLLADEDQALMWRGLMVQKAVAQFIEDADWSGIDYLLIDTPPGTGDIAMTLARLLPQMGQLVVTTPTIAAQRVAARAADFARKSNIRVLGVIENMSGLVCSCGQRHNVFGEGGGRSLSEELNVPLLCEIELNAAIAEGGDHGEPAVLAGPTDGVFHRLAQRVLNDVAPPFGSIGCTARMLDSMEKAVASAAQSS
ncbi:MAG TPA: Mrp/NBP35 family ATP-binding protein [Acidimicrobiales bacterium]|nr:Mrp/NBP35 family ATP-binding protein [Acidimicrobiales bacterium]